MPLEDIGDGGELSFKFQTFTRWQEMDLKTRDACELLK